MKLTSYSFITLCLIFASTHTMDNPNPTIPPKKSIMDQLGIFERLMPGTFATAEKSTDAFGKIATDGLEVKHNLADFTYDLSHDGVKHVMAAESIQQLNAASNNIAKTWITAGAGGALTLAGLILLLHTLMKKTEEKEFSDQPWYLKIISNRYLISALLMISGITLVLKSDKLVAHAAT